MEEEADCLDTDAGKDLLEGERAALAGLGLLGDLISSFAGLRGTGVC